MTPNPLPASTGEPLDRQRLEEAKTPRAFTSRERVLTALAGGEPDRVPYCEIGVDRALAQRLLNSVDIPTRPLAIGDNPYSVEENRKIANYLRLDNIEYDLWPPVYADVVITQDDRFFYGTGHIRDLVDLAKMSLPTRDSANESFSEAELFAAGKEDFALFFVTRIGVFSAMLSMGVEDFCLALFEKRHLVKSLIEKYVDWTIVAAEKAAELGFDVFVSTDDLAFKSGPFFSPLVFEEILLPHFQRAARYIKLPWIFHTDGNVMPYLEDLIGLGIAGFHPSEKGAMDIRYVKQQYGHRICVLGNVDLDLLARGSCFLVEDEVKHLINDLAPGGGYILTSGNSLTAYLNPENVLTMSRAVQQYGRYPIRI